MSLTDVQRAAIATPFFEHARTRLGVRPSGPPPVYAPELVVDAIQDAAQHPRHTVVVGGAAKATLLLQRVSPRLLNALSLATAFRLQRSRSRTRKAPSDSNSLFSPVAGDDAGARGRQHPLHRCTAAPLDQGTVGTALHDGVSRRYTL